MNERVLTALCKLSQKWKVTISVVGGDYVVEVQGYEPKFRDERLSNAIMQAYLEMAVYMNSEGII